MKENVKSDDRLIPWLFVMFFVGVAIIDGILVTIAVKTQTGLIEQHPYEHGISYNKVVNAVHEQEALGWKGDILYQAKDVTSGDLAFVLKDKSGQNIQPESVSVKFIRPTQAGFDFNIELELADNGIFTSFVKFPLPGLWEVYVYAKKGEEQYQQDKRIVLE